MLLASYYIIRHLTPTGYRDHLKLEIEIILFGEKWQVGVNYKSFIYRPFPFHRKIVPKLFLMIVEKSIVGIGDNDDWRINGFDGLSLKFS